VNITEANAFNTLMKTVALVGDESDIDASIEAAVLLADRSNKALGAGLTGGQVRELYADQP